MNKLLAAPKGSADVSVVHSRGMAGSSGSTLKVSILFVSFFVLCLACFRDPYAWLPRAFSWTPLRWLGNMSYSYYLLHGLALKAGFLALAIILPVADHGSWVFWALLPTMFALTLFPTAVLFLAVERPYSLAPHRPTSTIEKFPREYAPNNITKSDAPQAAHRLP